jgi:Bardet-Biedl syndrome 7 protein
MRCCLQVRGVTKKGKEFFRFTSGLTDAITQLAVAESHIWASCQQVHNHYVDGQDQGLYMAPDVIMATVVCTPPPPPPPSCNSQGMQL